MKPSECLQIDKHMQKDLTKHVEGSQFSYQVTSGAGFKYLALSSDILPAEKLRRSNLEPFLESYLATMELGGQAKAHLTKFCKLLPKITHHHWEKQELLFTNQFGKGTWVGVYFRRIDDEFCEFYSNCLKCAFELMPEVYVVREQRSNSIGPFEKTRSWYKIEERPRGFTQKDLDTIMDVCNRVTQFKTNKALN